MKHRLTIAAVLAVVAACALAATAFAGGKNRLYQFRGELLGASSTSVQVQVEGGNNAALRALLGSSQDESFAVGPNTEILVWRHGVPTVATVADLKMGDWVQVNVRTQRHSALAQILATPAGTIGDHIAKPNPPSQPLYLYVGQVAGPQTGGHIALNVNAGNRRALRTMIGQPQAQSFTYDENTIFLLWQGKVPTVIDPSQLKAGDRITVRVRASKHSTLAQIEATAARHVGDHEPGNPLNENS